jgi:hypothetical protein
VVARSEGSAKALAVSTAEFVQAGLIRANLLLLRPTNLAAKKAALRKLAKAVGEPFSVSNLLATFPQAFIYAVERIEAATLVIELGIRHRSLKSMLVMPRRVIDADLAAHASRMQKAEAPAPP